MSKPLTCTGMALALSLGALVSSCDNEGSGPSPCDPFGCPNGTVCDSGATCRPIRGSAMSIDLSEANSAVEEWTSTETTVIAVGTSFACETQLQPQPSAFLLLGRTDREVGVPHEVGIAPLWGIEYHEGGEQYFATTGSVEFSEIAASPGETTSGEVQFEAADQMISLLFEAYLCP